MRRRRDQSHERETLIVAHLPLARSLALRYRHGPQPLDDLFQVASLGLVKAADRWDPERGVAFSTYAVPTILGELRRYFRDLTWDMRPPRQVQELSLAVTKAGEELRGATGREPSVDALAARLDRSPADVVEALDAARARFLDSLDAEQSHSAAEATGRDDDGYERAETRATIDRLLTILDEQARAMIRMRYDDDLHQSEIAERLGTSQKQVSRVLRRSLEKLSGYCSITRSLSRAALASD
jgi:RNA polymerase sigma-B factor